MMRERSLTKGRTGVAARWLVCAIIAIFAAGSALAQGVTVFAAASLKDALDEVVRGYDPAAKVVVSYAASSALAKQIGNAAPADVFISADLDWMDYLDARGLIDRSTRVNLLRNRLVLIAPASSVVTLEIKPGFALARALGEGRLAMANPDSVPAGKYGKAALQHLSAWTALAGRVAPMENVRAALMLVSRGEAPLGIVYRTDAMADKNVRIVGEFPEGSHPSIVYPAAAVVGGKDAQARAFLNHLGSSAAKTIFRTHGF